jgi:DNA polymerase
MSLDARQRAMLREMGVRVWQASEAAAEPQPAQPPARSAPATMPAATVPTAVTVATPAARPTPVAKAAQPLAPAEASARAQGWQVGAAQALHPGSESDLVPQSGAGPHWLLLAEQRHDGGSGDAQRLLQAMLRAAKLHQGSQVWLAPLQRAEPAGAVQGLEQALAGTEPDLVFIMGRLGAQALLETDEPLGRLRGQVHELWGLPAIVSYDPVTLLRTPADKGKAWDDLCLALQLAREQYEERRASQGD